MRLNVLCNNNLKNKKRVGRGIGSGRGKTSSRGVKGQKSRSGKSINGFEGGQQSIITSLPKRGFRSMRKEKLHCLNIGDIQKFCSRNKIKSGDVIDNELLFKFGLIKSLSTKVKILGRGNLTIPVVFKVHSMSNSVKNIVETKLKEKKLK
ncbi:MAG: 50S ribosomal protein L15 [Rickettsiaceae bacterium H1]|nr:50S ribosomal protein L15 [Rickettsiaceae bacterium H1]